MHRPQHSQARGRCGAKQQPSPARGLFGVFAQVSLEELFVQSDSDSNGNAAHHVPQLRQHVSKEAEHVSREAAAMDVDVRPASPACGLVPHAACAAMEESATQPPAARRRRPNDATIAPSCVQPQSLHCVGEGGSSSSSTTTMVGAGGTHTHVEEQEIPDASAPATSGLFGVCPRQCRLTNARVLEAAHNLTHSVVDGNQLV